MRDRVTARVEGSLTEQDSLTIADEDSLMLTWQYVIRAIKKSSKTIRTTPKHIEAICRPRANRDNQDASRTKALQRQVLHHAEQRRKVRQWIGKARFVYNRTIEYLQQEGTKANWKKRKGGILKSLPDWSKSIPYQIKSIAIRDACIAVREAKKKYKETGEIQKVKFRSRKKPVQSCYIPSSAVTEKGI